MFKCPSYEHIDYKKYDDKRHFTDFFASQSGAKILNRWSPMQGSKFWEFARLIAQLV